MNSNKKKEGSDGKKCMRFELRKEPSKRPPQK